MHASWPSLRTLLPALALLVLGSCGPQGIEEPEKPAWLLPRDSMVMVLTDLHLVEGARSGQRVLGDSMRAPDRYYQALWKKYDISKARYDSNFRYYSRHAPQMNELYAEVLKRLSKLESWQQAETSQDSSTVGNQSQAQPHSDQDSTVEEAREAD